MYTGPPTTTTTTTTTITPKPKPRWPRCVLKEGYTLPEELEDYGIEIVECKPNEYCEDWQPKRFPTSGLLG